MRAVAHRGDALVVVRAGEALRMPDHVARADPEAVLQVARERERGGELRRAAHDVAVGDADVLDPDRGVVEPDGVPAAPAQRDELVDHAVAIDDEVRADAGPLAVLHVGRVGRERVERASCTWSRRCSARRSPSGRRAWPWPRRSGAASSAASAPCGRRRTGSGPGRSGLRRAGGGGRSGARGRDRVDGAGVAARGARGSVPAGSSTTKAVAAERVVLPARPPSRGTRAAGGQTDPVRVGPHGARSAPCGSTTSRMCWW